MTIANGTKIQCLTLFDALKFAAKIKATPCIQDKLFIDMCTLSYLEHVLKLDNYVDNPKLW